MKKVAHERFNRGIHETRIYQFRTFEVDLNELNYRASTHPYRLTFNPHTVFLPDNGTVPRSIPSNAYSFKPMPEIFTMSAKESETHLIGIISF